MTLKRILINPNLLFSVHPKKFFFEKCPTQSDKQAFAVQKTILLENGGALEKNYNFFYNLGKKLIGKTFLLQIG